MAKSTILNRITVVIEHYKYAIDLLKLIKDKDDLNISRLKEKIKNTNQSRIHVITHPPSDESLNAKRGNNDLYEESNLYKKVKKGSQGQYNTIKLLQPEKEDFIDVKIEEID